MSQFLLSFQLIDIDRPARLGVGGGAREGHGVIRKIADGKFYRAACACGGRGSTLVFTYISLGSHSPKKTSNL